MHVTCFSLVSLSRLATSSDHSSQHWQQKGRGLVSPEQNVHTSITSQVGLSMKLFCPPLIVNYDNWWLIYGREGKMKAQIHTHGDMRTFSLFPNQTDG